MGPNTVKKAIMASSRTKYLFGFVFMSAAMFGSIIQLNTKNTFDFSEWTYPLSYNDKHETAHETANTYFNTVKSLGRPLISLPRSSSVEMSLNNDKNGIEYLSDTDYNRTDEGISDESRFRSEAEVESVIVSMEEGDNDMVTGDNQGKIQKERKKQSKWGNEIHTKNTVEAASLQEERGGGDEKASDNNDSSRDSVHRTMNDEDRSIHLSGTTEYNDGIQIMGEATNEYHSRGDGAQVVVTPTGELESKIRDDGNMKAPDKDMINKGDVAGLRQTEEVRDEKNTKSRGENDAVKSSHKDAYNYFILQYSAKRFFNPFVLPSPRIRSSGELAKDGKMTFSRREAKNLKVHKTFNPETDFLHSPFCKGVKVPRLNYVLPDYEVTDERFLGYNQPVDIQKHEFVDKWTRASLWQRSDRYFIQMYRKIHAPCRADEKMTKASTTKNVKKKKTCDGGVGYVLGDTLPGPFELTAEEIENITFYPTLTPEGVRVDLSFALMGYTKNQMLATVPYNHSTALHEWQGRKPYSEQSPHLLEPTAIGYGTPNPFLPWKIPPCQGFLEVPPMQPDELRDNSLGSHSSFLLKALNEMGVYYLLDAGSLLGSYRHGGFIPFDKDVDVIVPVRRNLHLFGSNFSCAEIKEAPTEDPYIEHIKESGILCEMTPHQWANKVFLPLFEAFLNGTGITARVRQEHKMASIKLWTHCVGETFDFHNLVFSRGRNNRCYQCEVDVYLDFNPHTGDGACTCPWYDTYALCPVDTKTILNQTFGKWYMKPNRDLNKPKYASESFPHAHLLNSGTDRVDATSEHQNISRRRSLDADRDQDYNTYDDEKNMDDHSRGELEGHEKYTPALTYNDANRMYKEMKTVFPFMDATKASSNMAYHIKRLATVKHRVLELKNKRYAAERVRNKRARKKTSNLQRMKRQEN